jgi:hypothetical protein
MIGEFPKTGLGGPEGTSIRPRGSVSPSRPRALGGSRAGVPEVVDVGDCFRCAREQA